MYLTQVFMRHLAARPLLVSGVRLPSVAGTPKTSLPPCSQAPSGPSLLCGNADTGDSHGRGYRMEMLKVRAAGGLPTVPGTPRNSRQG